MNRLGLTLLAVAAFTSCIENEPVPVFAFEEAKLVRSDGWILTSELKQTEQGSTDLFLTRSGCVQDNVFTFYTDKKYVVAEGGAKCNTSDPSVKESGTWKMEAGVLEMITSKQDTTAFMMAELTDTRLKYSTILLTNGVIVSKTTYTFQPASASSGQ